MQIANLPLTQAKCPPQKTPGHRRVFFCLLLAMAGLLLGHAPSAYADYLQELKTQAAVRHLDQDPYWWQLLHYEKTWQGVHSTASTKTFFQSSKGADDPGAELTATLTGFFRDFRQSPDQSTQCLFIARYQWLKTQLHFDPVRLPESPCQEFHQWVAAINGHYATVIFASDYINNPSSMFGHTLLRLDTDAQNSAPLLAYTLNFAAQTQESNGLAFAIKGLTGGYPGMYSLLPYYEKVKEYNDLENRDLWEYRLDFNAEEIERMLAHIWEIRQVAFPYYFFKANCSWQLLKLLEVGRPSLNLAAQFPVYAIPADTVRVLTRSPGLVSRIDYRPANGTRLYLRVRRNEDQTNKVALSLTRNPDQAISLAPDTAARALETAYDQLYYLHNQGKTDPTTDKAQMLTLLHRRAKLEVPDQSETPPRPDIDPAHGHATAMIALRLAEYGQTRVSGLDWRPAYHDLMDPAGGYRRGSAIDFLHVSGSYRASDHQWHLDQLTLLDIQSLAPRNLFFPSLSWKLGLDAKDLPISHGIIQPTQSHVYERAYAAAGLTRSLDNADRLLCYGMMETQFVTGTTSGYPTAGLGPLMGVNWIQNAWTWAAEVKTLHYSRQWSEMTEWQMAANFHPDNENSWRIGLESYHGRGGTDHRLQFSWIRYF